MRVVPSLIAMVALVATACAPSAATNPASAGASAQQAAPTTAPAAGGAKQTLVVTSGGACICHAPLYVGMEKEIFAKYGLDVQVKRVASGFEGLSALSTGDANVADAVAAVVGQASQQGVEATAVFMANGNPSGTKSTDDYFAIIARPGAGINANDIKSLKGKKVGVAVGTVGHQYLHYALQAAGMDSQKDVEIQNVGPADLPAALQSGSVDAIVGWEPTPLQALGLVPNSFVVQRGGNVMDYLFMRWMSPNYITQNPAAVQAFVNGFAEAAQYARKNPEDTTEIVAKNFQGLDKGIIKQSLGWLTFDMRYSKASQDAVKQGLDFAKSVGALKGDYDFSQHVNLTFLNQTLKEHPEFFSDLPPIPANLQLAS